VVLALVLLAAVVGVVSAKAGDFSPAGLFQRALSFMLISYGSWALARELDPDDRIAAFISMAAGMLAALVVNSPGLLIVFTTLALARMVNRSSGLAARTSDSILVMISVFLVMYMTDSPFYAVVAGIAFVLDGTLVKPLRQQWVFGLICFAGTIVYMVDHDMGMGPIAAPESLHVWLSLLFLLIFALNILLLKSVQSRDDFYQKRLDPGRVRGAMMIGLLAAVQGIYRSQEVVILVAVISGICFGMAFRKGFKTPVSVS